MNEILEKNQKCLRINFAQMYELYEKYEGKRQEGVYVNGDFAAISTDRDWYFNSRYNSKEAAKIWASQYEIKESQLYIMAGLGNGEYAKALRKRLPDSCAILIYEPCTEIFLQAMENIDLSEILCGRAAIVVEDINKGHIYEYFMQTIKYQNRDNVHFCIHPNYDNVFGEQVKWLHSIVQNEIYMLEVTKNTEIMFSDEFFKNMMTNLWSYMSHSNVNELKKQIKTLDTENIPVVIVAAGPSLNKNINELKKYKGKAFIIACDSALNSLLKNGIVPDLSISLDSHKPLQFFSMPEVKNIPFVLCLQAVDWFRKEHQGRKFYFADNNLTLNIMHKYGKEPGTLETSGSVANNAFSVAQTFGFKNIILIGQDLAYENGLYYADGAQSDKYASSMQKYSDKRYFEVEGYFGGKVFTSDSLNFYRNWFEKQIIRYNDLNVINCTEGGAMIHGATNMKLVDALEKYQLQNPIDFGSVIEATAESFSPEEIEKVRADFNNFEAILNDMKREIANGVRHYRKMEDLLRKGKQNTNEFITLMNKVDSIQLRVNEEPLMDLAAMHNREMEYEVLAESGSMTGNAYTDAINAIHGGIKMLESYSYGIDKVIEQINLIYDNM